MCVYPCVDFALAVTKNISVKNRDLIRRYLNMRSFVPNFFAKEVFSPCIFNCDVTRSVSSAILNRIVQILDSSSDVTPLGWPAVVEPISARVFVTAFSILVQKNSQLPQLAVRLPIAIAILLG